ISSAWIADYVDSRLSVNLREASVEGEGVDAPGLFAQSQQSAIEVWHRGTPNDLGEFVLHCLVDRLKYDASVFRTCGCTILRVIADEMRVGHYQVLIATRLDESARGNQKPGANPPIFFGANNTDGPGSFEAGVHPVISAHSIVAQNRF